MSEHCAAAPAATASAANPQTTANARWTNDIDGPFPAGADRRPSGYFAKVPGEPQSRLCEPARIRR